MIHEKKFYGKQFLHILHKLLLIFLNFLTDDVSTLNIVVAFSTKIFDVFIIEQMINFDEVPTKRDLSWFVFGVLLNDCVTDNNFIDNWVTFYHRPFNTYKIARFRTNDLHIFPINF